MAEVKAPVEPVGWVDDKGVLWKATRKGTFVTVPAEGVETTWDILSTRCKATPTRQGFGWRNVLEREFEQQGNKTLEKVILGPYNFITYSEYFAQVCKLGTALTTKLGAKPGDRVVIFAETQLDWMLAAFACWRQRCSVVTIYATLGEDGVFHGVSQTRADIIFADAKLLPVRTAGAASTRAPRAVAHAVSLRLPPSLCRW